MLIKRKSIEKEESSRPARKKPKFTAVTLSEHDGVRYLHFGTEWVQGAMRLRKPDGLELEYAQQMMGWMLFIDQPTHIAQLGLGAAALTKFCYRQYPDAHVTAIELNPAVINVCHSMFALPMDNERLSVREMDALDFVEDCGVLSGLCQLPDRTRYRHHQFIWRPSELRKKFQGAVFCV